MTLDLTTLALGLRARFQRSNTTPELPSIAPVIGRDFKGQEIRWPEARAERAAHVLCLAASGAGKTVLLAGALVEEFIQSISHSRAPLTLFVIDLKGDLVSAILSCLALHNPSLLSRVVVLDPFSVGAYPFNLNHLPLGETPVDIRAQQLAGLVGAVSTATVTQATFPVGPKQLDAIGHVFLGALRVPDPRAHLVLALEAFTDPKGFKILGEATTSDRARQFLLNTVPSDDLRFSCVSRLRVALAASDRLERLVTAPTCLNFAELLRPGQIVLGDFGRPTGGLTSLQAFYALSATLPAIDHLLERPSPWRGPHCRIVIDEAQLVAPVLSERAEVLLTTGRSRGISLTCASQSTALLESASSTLLQILMGNTNTKLIGRLAASDAELLAREQALAPGSDDKVGEMRQRFSASVSNLADREFVELTPGARRRFRSIEHDLAAWEEAAAVSAAEIARARNRMALPTDPPPRLRLQDLAGRRRSSETPLVVVPGGNGAEVSTPHRFPARVSSRSPWG